MKYSEIKIWGPTLTNIDPSFLNKKNMFCIALNILKFYMQKIVYFNEKWFYFPKQ